MSKNNTIGRLTCPICGEPSQDLRVDKNGKLYMYCDNLCAMKFNGKMSKKYFNLLMDGQSVQIEKIGIITAIKQKGFKANVTESRPITDNRATIDGRSDRPVAGVRADDKPTGGFWRGLLSGDDEF